MDNMYKYKYVDMNPDEIEHLKTLVNKTGFKVMEENQKEGWIEIDFGTKDSFLNFVTGVQCFAQDSDRPNIPDFAS